MAVKLFLLGKVLFLLNSKLGLAGLVWPLQCGTSISIVPRTNRMPLTVATWLK